ncbi:MAG: hypothetical protein HY420_00115 [Candidatus Kerfeldbacteria bacterium]|nr:hypothetical protein [Candidatus Kerfeldbacteria bacterium]
MKKQTIVFAVFLVCAAAAVRVLRHFGFIHLPPNVAPIAALAMFGGAYLPGRSAFVLPLMAMLVSDALIGFYTPSIMAAVYLSFAISGLIGLWLRSRKHLGNVVVGSLVGSVVFFLLTNAAVWAFGTLYSRSGSGLMQSYIAGLPFFRNTVLGDLGFTGLMFGLFELVLIISMRKDRVAPAKIV